MTSQAERNLPFSYRMREGVSVTPAAKRAYDRVLAWIETTHNQGDEKNRVLADFSAGVVDSFLFELTKGTDKILGVEFDEEMLKRFSFFSRREGFNDDEIHAAQLIGLQEALRVLIDTSRLYKGSD